MSDTSMPRQNDTHSDISFSCQDIDAALNDYSKGQLLGTQKIWLEEHLGQCTHCQSAVASHAAYKALLSRLPKIQCTEQQAQTMVAKAIATGESNKHKHVGQRRGRTSGLMAASVLAIGVFLAGQLNHEQPDTNAVLTTAEQPSESHSHAFFDSDAEELIVVFNAPSDMPGASLTFDLPEDIAIADYGYSNDELWPVDLQAGANTLVLPLDIAPYIDDSQPLKVSARLRYGDHQKTFSLEIPQPLLQPPRADDGSASDRSPSAHPNQSETA